MLKSAGGTAATDTRRLETTIINLQEELAAGQVLSKTLQSALDEAIEASPHFEKQIGQLKTEAEQQQNLVLDLQAASIEKDTQIEEMRAKSTELSETNSQSLEMLDKMKAEIAKMREELEMVKAVPERDPELDEKIEVSSLS